MQINSLENILSNFESINSKKAAKENESSFTNILGDAINNVKETEAELEVANTALLTGESDNIHSAMIVAQKAEIAVSLAVQVRNKVIESYNTVMGMQL